MNDDQLIRNNLERSGSSSRFAGPWIHRWYILAFCFVPLLLVLFFSRGADDPNVLVLSGQFALAIGTFSALFQLRRKPLLNPVQAVVFLFHWWFAIGPCLAVLFAVFRNDADMLSRYISSGGEALWIVALGLPVYAFCANGAMRWSRGKIRHVAFLMPEGALYRPKTLSAYGVFGGSVALIVAGLAQMGIVGGQTIHYLGGKVSQNWFVSALEALSTIAVFAAVGALAYLAGPKQRHTFTLKVIAVALIVFNTVMALTSGWKGAIVQGFAVLFVVLFVWRQKVPYGLLAALLLSYLLIIEPFVNQMRFVAEVARIDTPEERVELFRAGLEQGIPWEALKDREVNIESPFRGIYVLADGVASDSSLFSGPWEDTVSDGLLALLPRALYPDKPDLNMGNYFARYLGTVAPDDYITNMGVSVPFEFVGNYGYIAGILSFGLIGTLWAFFCVWLLSEDRLATHPLAPACIIVSLGMEASAGQFLAKLRDLPLVLGAAFVVWILLKKRL